jgi:rhodanese-related sulfurtransferase
MNFLQKLFGGGPSTDLTPIIREGAFLVDVRTPGEFAGGSVPGAVNIPLDQIQQKINQFNNKKAVVVFCRSGMRSGQAHGLLQQMGIPAVYNGGTWQDVLSIVTKK